MLLVLTIKTHIGRRCLDLYPASQKEFHLYCLDSHELLHTTFVFLIYHKLSFFLSLLISSYSEKNKIFILQLH